MADENAQLRAALDEARRYRERAETAEREYRTVNERLRAETGGRMAAEETAVGNAIAQLGTEIGGYERQLADLNAEGKFAEAATLMTKMTGAQARLARYEEQKESLAANRTRFNEAPQQPQPEPGNQLSSREQDWVSRHPAWNDDQAFRNVAAGAAQRAVAAGHPRDSDGYFQFVDKVLESAGYGATAAVVPPNADNQTTQQQQQQPQQTGEPAISIPTASAPEPISFSPGGAAGDPFNTDQMAEQMFPQQRAIGNGGAGIRQVAAPPSRVIHEISNAHARGQRIEPTMDELEAARIVVRDIAPEIISNAQREGKNVDEEIIRTYFAWYNSPSSQRKLRRWYGRDAA